MAENIRDLFRLFAWSHHSLLGRFPMARQLRIEYPGAFYHITTRGNQKQPIVLDDRDRFVFLEYFKEANAKFNALFHAFCLMQNHYHLLLETLRGNLSKIMHFINTSYAVFFNKRHSRSGHFFQGRYKAILAEKDTYALELSRYIHLNPVRAGIVSRPEDYPYSSYREYMDQRPAESWLDRTFILGYFGLEPEKARTQYAAFVSAGIGRPAKSPQVTAGKSLILGSPVFIARIKKEYLDPRREIQEVPAVRGLKNKPALEDIHRSIELALDVKGKLARNAAIFLCRRRTDYTLAELSDFYRIGKSAVGKISGQMKEILSGDETLKNIIREIEKSFFG